jgi:multidrug efflux system membrane fusion protein
MVRPFDLSQAQSVMSESPSTLSRNLRRGGLLVLLVLLALLAWWLWPAGKAPTGAGGLGGPGAGPARFGFGGPVPVRVAPVTRGDFPIELRALGTVTAYNTAHVRTRVGGELVKVLFEEGQRVKAGDLLAVIDPRPYETALRLAEGQLQQTRAQLKNAEIDLARYQGLYKEDSIARQTLDTQQALVAQYQGQLKVQQATVEEARLNLDFTQIRAPISGRLGLRQVDLGNLLTSNDSTVLVTITQTEPIAVSFTLPEGELPPVLEQLRAGRTLNVEAWDRAERQVLAQGQLESLDNQIDTATGTLRLKARFANSDQRLFPNQFVNARLRVSTRQQALLIPAAALQYGSRGTFVYVVGEGDKVELRQVSAGPSSGELTVIESGVQPGERLVLEGTDRLRDGSPVQVIEDTPAATAKRDA